MSIIGFPITSYPFDLMPLALDIKNHITSQAKQIYYLFNVDTSVLYMLPQYFTCYQTHYPSKCWIFKSLPSLKVKRHSPQQLNFQYKECRDFLKMACVFAQTDIFFQPSIHFWTPTPSSTLANSHLHILLYYLFTRTSGKSPPTVPAFLLRPRILLICR